MREDTEIQGNGPVRTAVTKYGYDANSNLTKITTPKGFEIRRSYDADDRLTEERVLDKKNGIDRRTQYTYDEAGNILKRTILGADGERLESSARYDLKDRVTHRINPAGAVTRYLYDRNNKLLKEISPYGYESENDEGAGTTYAYDSRGNRIRVTNALGEMVQERSYNLQNRPVMQKDTFGNRTEFSYGLDGKIKDVRRLGDGSWNSSAGDSPEHSGVMALNTATSQSALNSQRTIQQYEYNARGQIVGVVDGNRNQVSYDVDNWGRITGIGFADDVKEGYEYTPAGQVSKATDGNGNSVQYHYNSLGKVSGRTDQLGYTETFQYDEEGNLSLRIDRDGRQLQRDCNVFGSPVYEKAIDAEGKNPNISTWHYDSLGRVTRAVCNGHSYEYVYDAQGKLKEKRSSGKRLVSYTYDRAGQITEIKDPAGVSTRYEYDILGRRSRIYNGDGLEVRYGYDALNRISHICHGNGVETAYTYDGDGNICNLETKAGENVLLSLAYQYDGNGNRTAKTGMQASVAQSSITTGNNALDISYSYDVRGQLLEERRNGDTVSYTYDKAGNRIKKTDVQGATLYQFNRKNQLITEESNAGIKQFTYDRQGGIVEEESSIRNRHFTYNSRHQQTKVETENGSVQENRYDAENLRYELLENGRKTNFVYHNGELLHEEEKEEQKTSYHLGAGIEAFRRGQELSYYHRDEQLSMAFITSGHGEIQNSYQYDAFGVLLEEAEQSHNRIRYAGQQYDDLTEQYYLRARYYNPVFGRFMQEDIYWGDGLNLYAYCRNNPVTYWDPSGYDGKHYSMDDIQEVLDYFNQESSKAEISMSNNSWNSFQHIVGGENLDKGLVHEAYSVLMSSNVDGHYIHRNDLSQDLLEQLKAEKVAGLTNTYYDDAIADGIRLDIGHKTNYEFWRTRNAAESLGWTQAQYNDFMTHNVTEHYQYEVHSLNISHVNENHSSDITKLQEEMLEYQKQQEENGNWKKEDSQKDQNVQGSCRGSKK